METDAMSLLTELFTDDYVVLLKWVVVFAVLIGGYIIAYKIYGKVQWFLSRERKRDMAIERGHVITAKLVKSWVNRGKDDNWLCHATYEYTVDGKTKKYRALFRRTKMAHRILHLYYVDSPRKVFATDDYHWENHKGILYLFIFLMPWLLASMTILLLDIPLDQFR